MRNKHTAQGFAHETNWARGQSWAIYSYVVCFLETEDTKYLDQAEKAFEVVARHPNMPEDDIPYGDYDAPDIPETFELCKFTILGKH